MSRILFVLLILGTLLSPQGDLFAYTDQIGVSRDEALEAARDVFAPYGIRRDDPEKGIVQSNWIQDHVTRKSQGLLKDIFHQKFDRRYRITYEITEEDYAAVVRVTGKFQQKPSSARPNLPWQRIRPSSEDYLIEKNFFDSLLAQLAHNKMQASNPSSESAP